MKIAMTADMQFDSYPALSAAGRSRLDDLSNCFKWVVGEADRAGCEAMLFLGDLFDDRVQITLPVLSAVGECIRFAAAQMEFVVLPGNHDSYLRQPSISSVSIFKGVRNVTLIDMPAMWNKFGMIPWNDDVKEIERAVLEAHKLGARYLCGHALVAGVAGPKGVDPAIFHADKFRHVFLGDVHDPTEVTEKILCLGSPCQLGYGDAGRERGFWIADTDKDTLSFIPNTISRRFYVIRNGVVPKGIHSFDYVRVEGVVTEEIRKECEWIESVAEEQESAPPRIAFSAKDSYEQIVRQYFEHIIGTGSEDRVDRLTKMATMALEAV